MPATIEDKISQLKAKRATIIRELKSAKAHNNKGRELPKVTQYLARQALIAKLPTDEAIDANKTDTYLDLQLEAVNNDFQDASHRYYIVTEDEMVNRFLSIGTDYKGQTQSCYAVSGGGVNASISVDPGKILGCGFASTEIGVSAGADRAKELLLVVQKHPVSLTNNLSTNEPVTLHPMYGVMWEAIVGASLFIGVKAEASVGAGLNSSEGLTSTAEATTSFAESDDEAPALSMELISLKAEAKAGFAADAGYKYQNICLFDEAPTYYARGIAVGVGLKPLFRFPESEDTIKEKAIEFQNKHKQNFTNDTKYVTILGVSRWASTVAEWLKQGIDRTPEIPPEIKAQAKQYLAELKPFYDSIPRDADSFLALSSHNPSGGAGLVAEASVSGSLMGGAVAAGEAKTRVDALKIKGSYKQANFRYQSRTPLGADPQPVLFTQDTTITYGQVDFTPVALEVSAEGRLGTATAQWNLNESLKSGGSRPLEVTCVLHNSMKYESVCTYWQKPAVNTSRPAQSVTALAGSGICFGRSVSIENLLVLANYDPIMDHSWQSPKALEVVTALAQTLHVSVDSIKTFIVNLDKEFHGLPGYLKDLKEANGVGAVLVEANFAMKNKANLDLAADSAGRTGIDKESVQALMETFITQQGETPQAPQAMRLRYRLADIVDNDSTPFKLGFKIFGTGAGISLKKVDRAGSEGIIDLATIWFTNTDATRSSEAYEQGVPPVTLFSQ